MCPDAYILHSKSNPQEHRILQANQLRFFTIIGKNEGVEITLKKYLHQLEQGGKDPQTILNTIIKLNNSLATLFPKFLESADKISKKTPEKTKPDQVPEEANILPAGGIEKVRKPEKEEEEVEVVNSPKADKERKKYGIYAPLDSFGETPEKEKDVIAAIEGLELIDSTAVYDQFEKALKKYTINIDTQVIPAHMIRGEKIYEIKMGTQHRVYFTRIKMGRNPSKLRVIHYGDSKTDQHTDITSFCPRAMLDLQQQGYTYF